mmetsp:Transcript_9421/g.29417  ORF Transcript_9421/g.29417 Transcript_9421/m.29417 type:complete len:231 (-) Transcript_9421:906-1598(-)
MLHAQATEASGLGTYEDRYAACAAASASMRARLWDAHHAAEPPCAAAALSASGAPASRSELRRGVSLYASAYVAAAATSREWRSGAPSSATSAGRQPVSAMACMRRSSPCGCVPRARLSSASAAAARACVSSSVSMSALASAMVAPAPSRRLRAASELRATWPSARAALRRPSASAAGSSTSATSGSSAPASIAWSAPWLQPVTEASASAASAPCSESEPLSIATSCLNR